MNWGPVLFGALILPVAGLLIWLGRRGAAGKIDFALGGHNRSNTSPEDWDHAHQIIGNGIIASGFGWVLAVAAMALGYLAGVDEGLAIGLAIGVLMISSLYLVVVVVRGLKAAGGH